MRTTRAESRVASGAVASVETRMTLYRLLWPTCDKRQLKPRMHILNTASNPPSPLSMHHSQLRQPSQVSPLSILHSHGRKRSPITHPSIPSQNKQKHTSHPTLPVPQTQQSNKSASPHPRVLCSCIQIAGLSLTHSANGQETRERRSRCLPDSR